MDQTPGHLDSSGVVVDTTCGRIRGRLENGAQAFKGIPYAASTAGANRFLPPQPVQPWPGVRDAFAYGPSAPQPPLERSLLHWYGRIQPVGEDCLGLNVYTPAAGTAARRPVMVWLHGGGWWSFCGTAPALHGAALATEGDVVVVTLNHRLGLFGHLWLDEPDPRFADAGNAGVLDLVAALRWVRDNIAAFGGDPGNVTIFGHSGGASKVGALMTAPAAQGLFHRAIAQSSSGGVRFASQEEAARMAHGLAARLGLPRATGAALQAVPMEQLVAAFAAAVRPFRPVLDGRTFTRHPFDPDAPPTARNIPFMAGNSSGETRLKMAGDLRNFALGAEEVARRTARFLQVDPDAAARILAGYRSAYPQASPSDLLGLVTTDYAYIRNTRHQAALQAAAGQAPVHTYLFDWRSPACDGLLQSPHAVEIPFLFGTAHEARDVVGTSPDHAPLTRMMIATWSAFARTGNPDNPALPHWPRYDAQARPTMVLDVRSRVESDPGGRARALLEGLPFFEYNMPMNYAQPA